MHWNRKKMLDKKITRSHIFRWIPTRVVWTNGPNIEMVRYSWLAWKLDISLRFQKGYEHLKVERAYIDISNLPDNWAEDAAV